MEGRLDVEPSNRPCGRISRSLAFAAMRKGEARMRRSKGPKPWRRTPLSDGPARRETPTVLNPSNRRIRTRMYGGVGGEALRGSPYTDRNDGLRMFHFDHVLNRQKAPDRQPEATGNNTRTPHVPQPSANPKPFPAT